MNRTKSGKFERKHQVWTPLNWRDGYYDNRGRFRVYRPDYPRAYAEGYALRYHVVWWLKHGEPHPKGTEIHHIDGSKDNDRPENLICLSNSEHQSIHKNNYISITCKHCGQEFKEHAWRVSERDRKFCSQKCYHAHPKSIKSKMAISKSLKMAYKQGKR